MTSQPLAAVLEMDGFTYRLAHREAQRERTERAWRDDVLAANTELLHLIVRLIRVFGGAKDDIEPLRITRPGQAEAESPVERLSFGEFVDKYGDDVVQT